MTKPLDITTISQLLTETKIEPSIYIPSDNFRKYSHVVICMDDQPLMFIGADDDPDTHKITDRLLNNEHFITLTQEAFSIKFKKALLKKAIIKNYFFHQREYMALAESTQGVKIGMNNNPTLVALFNIDDKLENENFIGYITTLCIHNSIMKCFFPDATNLSSQIDFKYPKNALINYNKH